jgi:RsiW-degrading membrane proteinase PrsW (M82 family)
MTGHQRLRVGLLGCVLGAISLTAIAIVVLLVVASVPDPTGLVLSTAAASIPALIYAGVILRLDRYEIEPLRTVAACFAWGAIGAILLSVIGGFIVQGVLAERYGADLASLASTVIAAPLIEESCKGVAILAVLIVARDEIDSTLDGLVYGALVGVGFAMTENILYFGQTYLTGGIRELGALVIARDVLSGLGHPAYTAVTGAAIGWARERHGRGVARFIVPVLGWCVAVALHAAWNGGLIVTAALLGAKAGLLESVAIQAAIVIAPAALVLYAIARMSARRELQILREELQAEVSLGTISQAEYLTIVDNGLRQRALIAARRAGGLALRRRQVAFFHTAGDLAFRHHHLRQGELSSPSKQALDENDRRRLAALRGELAAAGLSPLAP